MVLAQQLPGRRFTPMLTSNLLALALQEGCCLKTLECLLAVGSDLPGQILLRTESGDPARAVAPLLYAVETGNESAVAALLRAGADPLAVDGGASSGGTCALLEAVKEGDVGSGRVIARACKRAAIVKHGHERVRTVLREREKLALAAVKRASSAGCVALAAGAAPTSLSVSAPGGAAAGSGAAGGCGGGSGGGGVLCSGTSRLGHMPRIRTLVRQGGGDKDVPVAAGSCGGGGVFATAR
jgi:hypothetical protein